MNLPHRRFLLPPLAVVVGLSMIFAASAAFAQSTNRQIGTQFEVTADPPLPRPAEQPCIVSLFTGDQFAFFSDTAKTFAFTPPSDCSGPWQKVVLDIDFSENGGVQFDRTASLYLANTNIYFGTTPEPLSSLTNTWHVERDVTDYAALMTMPQTGTMVLQNCTTDCPPPFNTRLNGIFTVNAQLEFYPRVWDHGHGSQTPDVVLPLEQVNGSGGVNLPATITSPTDQLSTSFTFPTNVERVYLDVVSQSQSSDEQWYACFPDDLSGINDLFGCGHTNFRETEVMIDGQLAGIAPVSPWVYTGFIPDQWVPMPGAQTLNFVPYRVNLTPFAALVDDGKPHTVAVSVFNNDFYFSATASLLLFLDHGSKQVTGALTKNNLTSPSPAITENLEGTSTVTGTIGVTSDRRFTIAGYVNTSHGRVVTSLSQHQNFSSTETIDFDTVNGSVLDQNTSVATSLSSDTNVSGEDSSVHTHEDFSFPITVDVIFPVPSATFGFTVATKQNYNSAKYVSSDQGLTSFNVVNNSVQSSDVSPASSSQNYTSFGSDGTFYNCQIASQNNTLTTVSRGCTPAQH